MPKKPTPNLREDIRSAAAKEFAEKGFYHSSMDSIGQRVGMTKGAVYRYYRGKHGLFMDTFRYLQAKREKLFQQEVRGENPLDQLEALLVAHLSFHFEHPEFHRLLWILETELNATALGIGIRSEHRNLRAKIRNQLRLAARQGQISLIDPAAQAFQLAALLEGSKSQSFTMGGDLAPFLHEEDLVQSWLAPLRSSIKRRKRKAEAESLPKSKREDSSFFQPPF